MRLQKSHATQSHQTIDLTPDIRGRTLITLICAAILSLLPTGAARSDLIGLVVISDNADQFQAYVDDTVATPRDLAVASVNWRVEISQKALPAEGLADDIEVIIQHRVALPGHAGESAPNPVVLADILNDVVPAGDVPRTSDASVNHFGANVHMDFLQLRYDPIPPGAVGAPAVGGSQLSIQIDHVTGNTIPLLDGPHPRQEVDTGLAEVPTLSLMARGIFIAVLVLLGMMGLRYWRF